MPRGPLPPLWAIPGPLAALLAASARSPFSDPYSSYPAQPLHLVLSPLVAAAFLLLSALFLGARSAGVAPPIALSGALGLGFAIPAGLLLLRLVQVLISSVSVDSQNSAALSDVAVLLVLLANIVFGGLWALRPVVLLPSLPVRFRSSLPFLSLLARALYVPAAIASSAGAAWLAAEIAADARIAPLASFATLALAATMRGPSPASAVSSPLQPTSRRTTTTTTTGSSSPLAVEPRDSDRAFLLLAAAVVPGAAHLALYWQLAVAVSSLTLLPYAFAGFTFFGAAAAYLQRQFSWKYESGYDTIAWNERFRRDSRFRWWMHALTSLEVVGISWTATVFVNLMGATINLLMTVAIAIISAFIVRLLQVDADRGDDSISLRVYERWFGRNNVLFGGRNVAVKIAAASAAIAAFCIAFVIFRLPIVGAVIGGVCAAGLGASIAAILSAFLRTKSAAITTVTSAEPVQRVRIELTMTWPALFLTTAPFCAIMLVERWVGHGGGSHVLSTSAALRWSLWSSLLTTRAPAKIVLEPFSVITVARLCIVWAELCFFSAFARLKICPPRLEQLAITASCISTCTAACILSGAELVLLTTPDASLNMMSASGEMVYPRSFVLATSMLLWMTARRMHPTESTWQLIAAAIALAKLVLVFVASLGALIWGTLWTLSFFFQLRWSGLWFDDNALLSADRGTQRRVTLTLSVRQVYASAGLMFVLSFFAGSQDIWGSDDTQQHMSWSWSVLVFAFSCSPLLWRTWSQLRLLPKVAWSGIVATACIRLWAPLNPYSSQHALFSSSAIFVLSGLTITAMIAAFSILRPTGPIGRRISRGTSTRLAAIVENWKYFGLASIPAFVVALGTTDSFELSNGFVLMSGSRNVYHDILSGLLFSTHMFAWLGGISAFFLIASLHPRIVVDWQSSSATAVRISMLAFFVFSAVVMIAFVAENESITLAVQVGTAKATSIQTMEIYAKCRLGSAIVFSLLSLACAVVSRQRLNSVSLISPGVQTSGPMRWLEVVARRFVWSSWAGLLFLSTKVLEWSIAWTWVISPLLLLSTRDESRWIVALRGSTLSLFIAAITSIWASRMAWFMHLVEVLMTGFLLLVQLRCIHAIAAPGRYNSGYFSWIVLAIASTLGLLMRNSTIALFATQSLALCLFALNRFLQQLKPAKIL